MRGRIQRLHSRTNSWSSDDSRGSEAPVDAGAPLEEPVLIYHQSARSIVFRDQMRRASVKRSDSVLSTGSTTSETGHHAVHNLTYSPPTSPTKPKVSSSSPKTTTTTTIATSFQPRIAPLPPLELGPNEEFQNLLQDDNTNNKGANDDDDDDWTSAEREVVDRLQNQTAAVKTIKNTEWPSFLQHFLHTDTTTRGRSVQNQDKAGIDGFNSFVTSTSLLPAGGQKMRCFGSTTQYTVGVVFALPNHYYAARESSNHDNEQAAATQQEDDEVERTETWAWPAGYAAKTEFNVDGRGKLINGRKEALVPISVMRQYNDDYLNKSEYMVANKKVSGLSQIPYNEVYLRVGGCGRVVNGRDAATGQERHLSYDTGVGIPIALFVRTATYGNLISMFRKRARLKHVLGVEHIRGIPLLYMTPTTGVRVMTEKLQAMFWKIASQGLNPFQNSNISHKTTGAVVDESFMQQKMNELIDLDDNISKVLTAEELARLAGGWGATDESVKGVLARVMEQDIKESKENGNGQHRRKLQDVVNEGLVYAVRSCDFHTARQLLILYSVVAAQMPGDEEEESGDDDAEEDKDDNGGGRAAKFERQLVRSPDLSKAALRDLVSSKNVSAPPPPPLDTDRLRSATNSDGLLAVLGAAQVLRAMKDGGAKHRVEEVTDALEEWVEHGQHSLAFRITSWQNQRAAQGERKIAMESNSKLAAFAGKKAITNRKTFAQRLRSASDATDFTDARFLLAIHEIVSGMHSPCLRLELLQYVLGLDNRYSVAHVARSVELAATCLRMAAEG